MAAAAEVRRAVVYADYAQFYLQDVDAYAAWMKAGAAVDPSLPPAGWTDTAWRVNRIGVEPYSISVGTARTDLVETALLVRPRPPAEHGHAHHVVEADLEVASGVISLYGCTEDPGPQHLVEIPVGRYRVRVSYLPSGPPEGETEASEPGDYFCYWLDMWPADEKTEVVVVKQGFHTWAG